MNLLCSLPFKVLPFSSIISIHCRIYPLPLLCILQNFMYLAILFSQLGTKTLGLPHKIKTKIFFSMNLAPSKNDSNDFEKGTRHIKDERFGQTPTVCWLTNHRGHLWIICSSLNVCGCVSLFAYLFHIMTPLSGQRGRVWDRLHKDTWQE